MRVEQVTAHAFGPLANETMHFAPGLTIIYGVNESAKSSWHAAICSALVGRRRARGRGTSEDQRYAERHKPWDRSGWRVSAIITLDDGRRIELMQDLEGTVDCRARDLTLGRDVSDEIIHDGSPDASRWLGLDRKSFVATACVNQADLVLDLSDAEGLQEHLQRAASTRGVDATAAAALNAIDAYSRDHVGLDRANSTKPLRAAIDTLRRALSGLAGAQRDHLDFLALVEVADERKQAVADAKELFATCEQSEAAAGRVVESVRSAEEAHRTHDSARRRVLEIEESLDNRTRALRRAQELHEHFEGVAPDGIAAQDEQYQVAASATARWRALPVVQRLEGPTADQMKADLDLLPSAPDGATEPADDVRRAVEEAKRAVAVERAHDGRRPAPIEISDEPGLEAFLITGPSVARDLAAQLDAATPQQPEDTSEELERLRLECAAALRCSQESARRAAEADLSDERAGAALRSSITQVAHHHPAAQTGRRWRFVAAWAVVCVLGAILLAVGQVVPGIALLAAAGAVGIVVAVVRRRAASTGDRDDVPADVNELSVSATRASKDASDARAAALEAHRTSASAEARYDAAQRSVSGAAAGRDEVVANCNARGLPAESAVLRRLGALAEQVLESGRLVTVWEREARTFTDAVASADDKARAVFSANGHEGNETLDALLETYVAACRKRASQAALASRRPYLSQAVADRVAAEAVCAHALQLRDEASRSLFDASRVCGLGDPPEAGDADTARSADSLARALDEWQHGRDSTLENVEHEQQMWAELNTLLDGVTIDELESSVAALAAQHASAIRDGLNTQEASSRLDLEREQQVQALGIEPPGAREHQGTELFLGEAKASTRSARQQLDQATSSAGDADGALRERARGMLVVAEAEEAVASCELELERVQQLDRTLALTRGFLSDAQDRVHRDIAPRLAKTLREWLPGVTANRYVDAMIDPAKLEVSVCGSSRQWRAARCLSVGTAEQIYLLLRVALAQHLTTTGESCPLLLDDVTVQADDERTRQILQLLLRLSEQRQIILFAQEPVVAEWARAQLADDPRHAIRELEPVPMA